jgi:periplasmic protein TonB
MFDDLVLSGKTKRTHKSWTVLLSTIVQGLILGIMILIPLIYTEALPKTLLTTFLVAPPPPPPPPPPAAAPVKVIRPKIIPTQTMTAPRVIPKNVAIVKDEAPDLAGVDGGFGVAGGTGAGGVLGGILGSSGPAPPKIAAPARIKVGGNVQAAKMLRQTLPIYPQIAKTAHVSGTVILHAIISKDGTVQELQYVSGPPLLMKAAMDAVHDWRYTPTQLNGDPVEVDTTISVVFSLGG